MERNLNKNRLLKSRAKDNTFFSIYKILEKRFGRQDWWPGDTPFEVMIGAILTQNTSWSNVEKAIINLKREQLLLPSKIKKIPEKKLARFLRPAGYFNVKAKRLKDFVVFLYKEYGGSVKRMARDKGVVLRDKLLSVKGIGPETADSILLYALEKPFFVIDSYTKRIFSRHGFGLVKDDYDKWQQKFVKRLPVNVSLYNDYHAQIVRLAKDYCKTKACCGECPLRKFFIKDILRNEFKKV